MGKNNEVITENVEDEVTETVDKTTENEPTVAELMAKLEAMNKVIEDLKSEKAEPKPAKKKPKADPFKQLVDFELPLTQYEHEDVSVCLCGRHYQIKRGYKVRIPECIVMVIKESQAQDLETFNKIRELVEKTPV